jgi:ATP-dependent DNA helicase DinG
MADARQVLGPEGPLAGSLGGYEQRRGQLDMAEAVEHALADDRILLCEAGTGTGKTFAYLVPALLSGRKVVVSTASRALQEQIHDKDLPAVRALLGVEAPSRLVKGLGNYLCLRRFDELRRSPSEASEAVREALPQLEAWALGSERGDVAELGELAEDHPIWREVTASSDTRLGSRCPHHVGCHVTRMKRDAQAAQLLVVNHHLLLADLVVAGDHPGSVLPPYDALIIDEAHKLEDVATAFFGARVSSRAVERLLGDVRRALAKAGVSTRAQVELAERRAGALFAAIQLAVAESESGSLPRGGFGGTLREAYQALDDALGPLELEAHDGETAPAAASAARRLADLRARLGSIAEPQRARVTRVERNGGSGLEVSSSPVDVGPTLRERLFGRGHAVVLTSASLTSGGRFDFLRSRLGLAEGLEAPVDELVVEPDLDHRRQALLYTPTDLPAVDAPAFVPRAAERIAELLALTPGGAFVLCTSNRALAALGAELGPLVGDRELMVQGRAPKAALLARFRDDGRAVLLATMSFWEGVDVPGSALAMVVIDRLPFAVPSDPLVVARCQALERAGRDPFASYSVPQAAITLKQGCGRLLRTRLDQGVLAVLDRRICTRSYGHVLLESLPDMSQTRDLGDVAQFWERRHDGW